MLNKTIAIVTGAAIAGMAFVGQANAACTQADLVGRFQVFLHAASAATWCYAQIDSGGRLKAGLGCVQFRDGSPDRNLTIEGSRLTMRNNCQFSGYADTSVGNQVLRNYIYAVLAPDKGSASGIGKDQAKQTFNFTAQRVDRF